MNEHFCRNHIKREIEFEKKFRVTLSLYFIHSDFVEMRFYANHQQLKGQKFLIIV